MYRCPKCKEALIRNEHSYTCINHHNYDIAKNGYVNLLLGHKKATGDQVDMVHARTMFLAHGYYETLRQRIIALLAEIQPEVIIDMGCGQGYYTNAFAQHLSESVIYGFDLSKYALKEATKHHSGVHYGVASISHLPLFDACADMILSIFTPVYETEIMRLLKQDGYFLRIGPGQYHLWEMKQVLYENPYANEPLKPLNELTLIKEESLSYTINMKDPLDIQALFAMTPYAYRTGKEQIARLQQLTQLTLQCQFQMELWRK